MTRTAVAAAAILAIGAGLTAGCTSGRDDKRSGEPTDPPAYRLVSFDSCPSALEGLRAAARRNLTAWGTIGGRRDLGVDDAAPGARAAEPQAASPGGAKAAPPGEDTKAYSGTNTHEAGVDEPDLVKTDGKRIITVRNGVLRVIDATRKEQVARVAVAGDGTNPVRYGAANSDLLLAGDKVLLISKGFYGPEPVYDDMPDAGVKRVAPRQPAPQLVLVDLAGTPRVVSRYTMTGGVIDARQVGSTVRVVMRSMPSIEPPVLRDATAEKYADAMAAKIDKANVEDWLPTFTVDNNGRVSTGRVDCSALSHPAEYSAASLLTVLTFDLSRSELGDGEPVSIAADGETVYSDGPSLYVANDQHWRGDSTRAGQTDIYKFDTSKPGKPAYVAGGAVDGWLLNQYSMSHWNGHLRVATTTGSGRGQSSESAVYVLKQNGKELGVTGKVGGLGKGERIYSVRFVGGTGYVVTFRQTDPLYTLDLRDPAAPKVTGELKITGYSAYLHPAGDGRLIGVGQEASEQGRTQGTQVSLFDVSDPAAPKRLAQYHVRNAHSEAEADPHAFLYWAPTGLLVLPMNTYKNGRGVPTAGAVALTVKDSGITELGLIEHENGDERFYGGIRRSLVIDRTLWTVSDAGLLASDLGTAARVKWVATT
jgi:hypothetical protein